MPAIPYKRDDRARTRSAAVLNFILDEKDEQDDVQILCSEHNFKTFA